MSENVNDAVSNAEIDEERLAEAEFVSGFTGQPVDPADYAAPTNADGANETESSDSHGSGTTISGLNEDQITALLAKASEVDSLKDELKHTRDQLFGKFGEINRSLLQLQQQEKESTDRLVLSADKFPRLNDEFPGLAEALAGDLSELNAVNMGGGDYAEAFENLRREYDDKILQATAETAITIMRPDWRSVIASPEFTLYKSQMPQEEREKFDSTWDPYYMADTIKQFDAWQGAAKKASSSKARLAEAVQPRGFANNSTVSDDDAFEAGFRSVRGK